MFRSVDLRGEYLRHVVLHHARGVGRNALALTAVPGHEHLEKIAVMEHIGGETAFPYAAVKALQGVSLGGSPVVESADQMDRSGVRSQFAEDPAAVGLAVKPEVFIRVGEFGERSARIHRQLLHAAHDILVPADDSRFERIQPGIVAKDIQSLCCFLCHKLSNFLSNFYLRPHSPPCRAISLDHDAKARRKTPAEEIHRRHLQI